MHCSKVKMEVNEPKTITEYTEFEEDFKNYSAKIEDVDITEQFIDVNGVHERTVYLENVDENDFRHSSKLNGFHDDSVHFNCKEHKCHLCGYTTNRKKYQEVRIWRKLQK
ncbi:uncharacterized protein LOC123672513 isoform X4 [Harmonia axyridis]|uniref:uncharacterized protein LOC123672513 isoform X4 n=1 Tax=Harmonia axyridis TaxID=115357 RepID=UPI001E276C83|nr:uncharacterized protein LOC123672513 isoform X4 [Harmonia axyridis]